MIRSQANAHNREKKLKKIYQHKIATPNNDAQLHNQPLRVQAIECQYQ